MQYNQELPAVIDNATESILNRTEPVPTTFSASVNEGNSTPLISHSQIQYDLQHGFNHSDACMNHKYASSVATNDQTYASVLHSAPQPHNEAHDSLMNNEMSSNIPTLPLEQSSTYQSNST
jgi:hypothetical protein